MAGALLGLPLIQNRSAKNCCTILEWDSYQIQNVYMAVFVMNTFFLGRFASFSLARSLSLSRYRRSHSCALTCKPFQLWFCIFSISNYLHVWCMCLFLSSFCPPPCSPPPPLTSWPLSPPCKPGPAQSFFLLKSFLSYWQWVSVKHLQTIQIATDAI